MHVHTMKKGEAWDDEAEDDEDEGGDSGEDVSRALMWRVTSMFAED